MRRLAFFLAFALFATAAAAAEPQWLTLPPTPTLPKPEEAATRRSTASRSGTPTFGSGEPVVLLHGGLANSDYWGNQVRALARHYRVIVMDSRGHGRSTRDERPYGYDLMAADVLGLMDFLKIRKAAIVGWSDGAILGLDIAMHHPERLTKLFAFAANSDPSGVADIANSPVFTAYIARAEKEYGKLSPTPTEYQSFRRPDHQDVGDAAAIGRQPICKPSRSRPGSSMPTMTRRSSARTRSSWRTTFPAAAC